jgi:AcrR family transcriptional regulator
VDRLPPGRHGLPRVFVAENQRERLLNGVVEAVAEHGWNATTIAAITAAAKISRRTFYEYFEGRQDCRARRLTHLPPSRIRLFSESISCFL